MRCIVDKSHNPYWNLAAEEYILNTFDTPTIRLWQNSDSIIVGKNQNTLAQINLEYVKNQNIAVVRRVTGGGAVFHDLGNINFSFFDYKSGKESNIETFHRFSIPIIEALKSLGADAAIQGRNDIAIDGKKVSGCAMLSKGKRILCHGTLLYNSNISNLADALKGADIFVGVSAPNIVTPEMVSSMNKDSILFAMANPTPEIMPDLAKEAGARIVGTGRSDFPNQVNNVVAFPGIFKGALEGRAKQITEEMKLAAANAIASLVSDEELADDNIMPQAFDPRVADVVANAVKANIRD